MSTSRPTSPVVANAMASSTVAWPYSSAMARSCSRYPPPCSSTSTPPHELLGGGPVLRGGDPEAVVGEIGQAAGLVLHAVAERPTAPVGDVGGGDGEPLDVEWAGVQRAVPPRALQPVRSQREVRG